MFALDSVFETGLFSNILRETSPLLPLDPRNPPLIPPNSAPTQPFCETTDRLFVLVMSASCREVR